MDTIKRRAHVAGALYVLLSALGIFGLMVVPTKLIVRGNAAATAKNILANETLFRIAIADNVLASVLFIFVAVALYRLLAEVDAAKAALMVMLAVLSVPIALFSAAMDLGVLTVLHGGSDFLSVFDRPQLESLAMLLLRLHHFGDVGAEMFWGLWLFPLAALIIRSRFIPKILGVLLIINGCAYVVMSLTSIATPDLASALNRYAMIAETGELWTILWLLIFGARVQEVPAAARPIAEQLP